MSMDKCTDNRFEIIDKAQRLLIERTNITDAPDEMKVLYSILYRCWQMGWLDRLDGTIADMQAENAKLVMKLNAEHIVRQNVERENAKLRELVRDMHACIEALCSIVENSPGCSMCLTNQDEEKPCAAADVYCRMRELGVDA